MSKKLFNRLKVNIIAMPIIIGLTFSLLVMRNLKIYESDSEFLLFYFLVSLIFIYYGIYKNHSYILSLYYFLSYTLLIIYKSPEIFIFGRFFAEEGSVFWSYTLANEYLDILQYLIPSGGYFTLNVNLAMILVKLLPIAYAPFVTIYLSFFISVLPAFFAYKYNFLSLNKVENNYLFGLYLFLHSLHWPEVSLNTINSQVYFGVLVFLILTFGLKNDKTIFRFIEQLILFISFMSTFYAVVQFPIILIRYLKEKNKYLLFTLFSTFFTSSIQSIIFFFSRSNSILYFEKANDLPELRYIYNTFVESFLLNVMSVKYFKFSVNVLIVIAFFILYFLKNRFEINTSSLILLNIGLQLLLIVFGQASLYFADRYAVVLPTVAFTFVLLLFRSLSLKFFKIIIVTFFLLNVGIFTFYESSFTTKFFYSCSEACVQWSQQLESNVIEHWPVGGNWTTDFINPKPNPSYFQIETFNFDYEKYYNFKLSDMVKEIFDNILQK